MRVLRYLIVLLTDEGQGWLRWRTGTRSKWNSLGLSLGPSHPDAYLVAPPLHRAWWCVLFWIQWVFNVREIRDDAPFDWTPTKGFFRDEDRGADLRNAWLGSYHEPRWYAGHPLGPAHAWLIAVVVGAAVWVVGIAVWAVLLR